MATYCTLAEFKNITGIKVDDTIVLDALKNGLQEMQKKIFIPKVYQSHSSQTRHKLVFTNPSFAQARLTFLQSFADLNGDLVVDKNDLNAFEIDNDFNVTDRNANITSFDSKYGVVDFDTALPTSSKTLVIEYSTAIARVDQISSMLKELNRLIAVNYVFANVPFSKLQRGISNWAINGVSVSFDLGSMQQVLEGNRRRIKDLYHNLTPIHSRVTRIRSPSIGNLRQFRDSISRTGGFIYGP